MKRLLALLLLPLHAFAGTALVTWAAPTQYTNNTAITGQITYKVYRGLCAGTKAVVATVSGLTYTDNAAPDNANVGYQVSAVVAGMESALSAEGCKPIPPLVPNPPTNLTVTVAVVAGINMAPVYKLTSTGKRSPDPAGFVPVNVGCIGNVLFTYRGQSFRKVDYTKVSFWNTVPDANVAAPCKAG
jgi:hypothetical protein